MGAKPNKTPIVRESASSQKVPRHVAQPDSWDKEQPCWQLGKLDFEGPWSWGTLDRGTLLDQIHSKLGHFETMTWAEILRAAGGRSSGNNSHSVALEDLCKEARRRLEDLKLDDIDALFSLRLAGTIRVWGIREGRVLRVLWYDPKHEVCPSTR